MRGAGPLAFGAGLVSGWAVAQYGRLTAPAAPEWGTVGEWVGGLATAGALAIAAFQVRELRRSEQRADLRQRTAAARSVSVVADLVGGQSDRQIALRVRNAADTPVFEALCIVFSPDGGTLAQVRIGTVAGGSDNALTARADLKALPWSAGHGRLRTELRFVDAYGTTWRAIDGRLEELLGAPDGP